MLSQLHPDGTYVTTHLLAGTSDMMAIMMVCPHTDHTVQPHTLTQAVDGTWMVMETCNKCRASRARHSMDKTLIEKLLP